MYIQYKTNTSWNGADLISDLSSIITGSTDISSLSASCDKPNSTIIANSVAASWTLFDNVGDVTYSRVFSAPDYTGTTTKYIKLHYNSTGGIVMTGYSGWNPTTHVGTDTTTSTGLSNSSVTTTLPLILYILVTTEYLCIVGYQNGVVLAGNPARSMLAAELIRDAGYTDYYNIANLKSNLFVCNCGPRAKNNTAAGELTNMGLATAHGFNYYTAGGYFGPYPRQPSRFPSNNSGVSTGVTVSPTYIISNNGGYDTSVVSKLKSTLSLIAPSNPNLTLLDEVVIDSTTYVLVSKASAGDFSNASILIPKV